MGFDPGPIQKKIPPANEMDDGQPANRLVPDAGFGPRQSDITGWI